MTTENVLPTATHHQSLMRRWFDWMLPRKGWVFALALLWGAAGLASFLTLKRDLFPDLSLPSLNLLIQSPGRAATELELTVAQPVEQALGGLPGVKRVVSTLQAEVVQIVVSFEGDTDPWRARQLVAERLAGILGSFPEGTRAPLVSSAAGRLQEIMEIVLEGPAADPIRLRDHAEQVLIPRLQAVPGVARVERLGGEERQLQVIVQPERMRLQGVSLDQILEALDGSHQDSAAGVMEIQDKGWFITVGSLAAGPETVKQLRLKTPQGAILLGDVADVREGAAFRRGLARHQGHQDVSLRVVRQPSAETLTVAKATRQALDELRQSLPQGMELTLMYDQGTLVNHALDGVTLALLLGGVFVALVLVLLLGNLRAALIVIVVLPLATLGAAIPLKAAGLGLNAMTLGGLAIAVGLLVDAAVIMVENLAHRLNEQRDPGASRQAALTRAAAEVGLPILTAVLVILAVFIPLLALGGLAGRLYAPLALAIASAMTLSLLLSFTLVPALVERFLPPGASLEEPRLVQALKRIYRPALTWAMAHGALVRVFALGLTIPSLWLALNLGSNFLPTLDEGALLLNSILPAETSLAAVDEANFQLEQKLVDLPGVASVYRRTGRSELTEDPMPHTISDVLVVLDGTRRTALVQKDVAERIEDLPFPVELTTPMQMRIAEGIGGTPADIQVKLFHPDLAALQARLPTLQEALAKVPGVASLTPEGAGALPKWTVVPDEDALRRLDVPRTLIAKTLKAALQGQETAPRFVGPQRIERVVRFPDDGRTSPESLKRLPLVLGDGRVVDLGQVAHFQEASTPSLIRREAAQRRLALNIRTDGDLGGTAKRLEQALKGFDLPKGTVVKLGGKIEEARDTQQRLRLAIGAALILVVGLLYMALRRWREVMVVVLTLPDAFAGGLFALWLAGETWNISSIVGMIGLFGVAVQNSLVLISQAKQLMVAGLPFEEALKEASLGRVRPKLMTAGSAILGLMPMLLGLGGSELERPLAIVMVGGLITSTLFTLLALPSFYAWVGRPHTEEPAS
ncbi:efflux RND transporter permease subunit [Geothrix sp. PMB-07]|uniref:efflux RND transporter permease subunit n=1 Tax=Geothrix sp. PMB-07 TaxID=3068640 RepID=UPI002742944A|nr:efflux RND transporter permease subunit [Geothrix sp. PMB-07]WLT31603.1 efflux RND transporter permease subunit [Geothrix sp. PMB-07]